MPSGTPFASWEKNIPLVGGVFALLCALALQSEGCGVVRTMADD